MIVDLDQYRRAKIARLANERLALQEALHGLPLHYVPQSLRRLEELSVELSRLAAPLDNREDRPC